MNNFPDNFQLYVEEKFGNENAIGIVYHVHGENNEQYIVQADHPMVDDRLLDVCPILPNGNSATVCTNYAKYIGKHVADEFNEMTRVVGFFVEDNQESLFSKENIDFDGHDFAIVAERYLVDPWIRLVAGTRQKIVYDLTDPVDRDEAFLMYGHPEKWSTVSIFNKKENTPVRFNQALIQQIPTIQP